MTATRRSRLRFSGPRPRPDRSDAEPSSKAETRNRRRKGGAAGPRQDPANMRDKGMQEAKPGIRRCGPLSLLRARRFGPMWTTQFLSAFNDNALKNALVLMLA